MVFAGYGVLNNVRGRGEASKVLKREKKRRVL